MQKVCSTLFVVLFASASFAQTNPVLRWQRLIGLITAPGVNNPVAGIASGGAPWATTAGTATVNLSNGAVAFQLQGLVLIGTNASGTPGGITRVVGTLVCGPGTSAQAIFDTPTAVLTEQGDLRAFRTYQKQPAHRDRPLDEQLHGFMWNRKQQYAVLLVEALDLERVPRALDRVLAHL